MQPLISDMVQEDPRNRPTMDSVVSRFEEIRANLSWSTLRRDLFQMMRIPVKGDTDLSDIFLGLLDISSGVNVRFPLVHYNEISESILLPNMNSTPRFPYR